MYEIALHLDVHGEKTLYEQIYEYLKDEIQRGAVRHGERLPSTRMMASRLEVSRTTVQLAYEQLVSEGYVENVPCRGYYVCQVGELYRLDTPVPEKADSGRQEQKMYKYDFSPNGVDLKYFPYPAWRKLNREVLQDDQKELLRLGDAQGEVGLRNAIGSYLHQARGVQVHPSRIVVGAGNDYLLMLLRSLLGGEYRIAMESPTYRHAYRVFQSLGYDCCTVSMDRHGMNVQELWESGADIAYVMPSHQFPLGTVMPIRRRQELLRWAAAEPGRYILEDDYDSEFRYVGKPIPALQGIDGNHRVIYMGTFSKSIAPAIRISYLVLPPELSEGYESIGRSFSCTVSRTDQKMLQLFMERGYFERHLNRMRAVYKGRHDILLSEIRQIGGVRKVLGERAGVHILLQFSADRSEKKLVEGAAGAGVRVYPLSEYCIDRQEHPPTVLLGYAGMEENGIREAVRLLAEAWNGI